MAPAKAPAAGSPQRAPSRSSDQIGDSTLFPLDPRFRRNVVERHDLTQIPAQRLAMLEKFYPPTGKAAVFKDESFRPFEANSS
jgi:hypothetical protein